MASSLEGTYSDYESRCELMASTQIEDAVREALQNPSAPSISSTTFSPTSVSGPATNGFSTSLYQGTKQNAPSTAASPSQLAQISTMLSNGDKRDAALYAASNGLWSHALLISSNVDQEFWREIVSRFSGAELHAGVAGSAGLKACYTLFGGASSTTSMPFVARVGKMLIVSRRFVHCCSRI